MESPESVVLWDRNLSSLEADKTAHSPNFSILNRAKKDSKEGKTTKERKNERQEEKERKTQREREGGRKERTRHSAFTKKKNLFNCLIPTEMKFQTQPFITLLAPILGQNWGHNLSSARTSWQSRAKKYHKVTPCNQTLHKRFREEKDRMATASDQEETAMNSMERKTFVGIFWSMYNELGWESM